MPAFRFVMLAGAGWLLDMALFAIGVGPLGLAPAVANMLSATVAAMAVFLASPALVFRSAGAGEGATLVYLLYTEANIVLWALCIGALTTLFVPLLGAVSAAALLAKVLVTPLSLICNFFVTSLLLQRGRLAR